MKHWLIVQEPKRQSMTPWCRSLSKNILASPEESSFKPPDFREYQLCSPTYRFALQESSFIGMHKWDSYGDKDIGELIHKRGVSNKNKKIKKKIRNNI